MCVLHHVDGARRYLPCRVSQRGQRMNDESRFLRATSEPVARHANLRRNAEAYRIFFEELGDPKRVANALDTSVHDAIRMINAHTHRVVRVQWFLGRKR